jgi:glyoxylate/hydroxypyruvate reductase A
LLELLQYPSCCEWTLLSEPKGRLMTIAVSLPAGDQTEWRCPMLRELMPDREIYPMDQAPDPEKVSVCVVWRPAAGAICRFENLKAIVQLGAGVDHVLADEQCR